MGIFKKTFQFLPESGSKHHNTLVLLTLIIIGTTSLVDYFINHDSFFFSFWIFGLVALMALIHYLSPKIKVEKTKPWESVLLILLLLFAGYFLFKTSGFTLDNKTTNQVILTNNVSEKKESTRITDDYNKYIEKLDNICPNDSTAIQSKCLDKEYNKQQQKN